MIDISGVNHRSDSKPIAFCRDKQSEVAHSVAMHDFPGPKWTGWALPSH
jgi:hypothetical protein